MKIESYSLKQKEICFDISWVEWWVCIYNKMTFKEIYFVK